ncbi:class I SAM-dependent methyltransferase [Candidatus Thorarchaeota archaeon]|nr:MAG: class I SAM-dependent methyltransferase [Candidatus Thorarchaeota archaeon]
MPDVFGMVLLDAANCEEAIHEIERDDGYVDESVGKQYVAQFEDWPEGQRKAIASAKGRVLDIGCGAGRVSMYLQEHGHRVTGIDSSPGAIEASKRRGVEDVRLMDAANLDFSNEVFDTVIMFGNNFGILGDPDRVVGMLRRLHDITTPDAVILAESRNPLTTDNPVHLAYHQKNRDRGHPPGLVKIRLRYKGVTGNWWRLLLATPELMKSIAEKAGWNVAEILGDESIYVGVLKKA